MEKPAEGQPVDNGRWCCRLPEFRAVGLGPRGGEVGIDETVEHCVFCKARHFELTVDPLRMQLTGSPIGG